MCCPLKIPLVGHVPRGLPQEYVEWSRYLPIEDRNPKLRDRVELNRSLQACGSDSQVVQSSALKLPVGVLDGIGIDSTSCWKLAPHVRQVTNSPSWLSGTIGIK